MYFYNKAVLEGLSLSEFMVDVCVYMFFVYDLFCRFSLRKGEHMSSVEMCTNDSLISLIEGCVVKRMLKSTEQYSAFGCIVQAVSYIM